MEELYRHTSMVTEEDDDILAYSLSDCKDDFEWHILFDFVIHTSCLCVYETIFGKNTIN